MSATPLQLSVLDFIAKWPDGINPHEIGLRCMKGTYASASAQALSCLRGLRTKGYVIEIESRLGDKQHYANKRHAWAYGDFHKFKRWKITDEGRQFLSSLPQ